MEQFRDRLVDLRSLDDIQELIQVLAEFELSEKGLPFFVVRSILEAVHERLCDRPLKTVTWNQVREALRQPMESVLDAHAAPDRVVLFDRLTALVNAWARTRRDLVE